MANKCQWSLLVVLLAVAVSFMLSPSIPLTVGLAVQNFIKGLNDRRVLEPLYENQGRNLQNLEGQNCFVTGANRGLGFSIASELAANGCHVYLGYRSKDSVEKDILKEASELGGKEVPEGSVEKVALDLSDLDSVTAAIEYLEKKGVKLNVFVTNAAVVPPSLDYSKQGFELAFGVNYLGHYHLLTNVIDRKILTPPPDTDKATIIMVGSDSHTMAPPLDETFGCPKNYTITSALQNYGHTKLLVTSMAMQLHKLSFTDDKYKHIHLFLYDPGPVASGIHMNAPPFARELASILMKTFFKTTRTSAMPVGYFSITPRSEFPISKENYIYYMFWTRSNVSDTALNEATNQMVWDLSAKLIENRGPIQSICEKTSGNN